MLLENKTAIVTGASSGIGAAFSKALTRKGAHVFGLARRADRLAQLQNELGDLFHPVAMDINDPEKLEDWVAGTFKVSDPNSSQAGDGLLPDILINNAGLGLFGAVEDISPDQWDLLLQTNLTSVFRLTRLVVPMLKQNQEVTHIVNISSVAGLMGNPNISAYNATKFGLRGFSNALMKELRNDHIKVTCMFPGSIATEFFEGRGGTHPNMMHPDEVARTLIHILETTDNFLIDEITLRPLVPKAPGK